MQARLVATLGELNRRGHAFPLLFQPAALVAVHHHESNAQVLETLDHLGAVLSIPGGNLFGRGSVAGAAVAPDTKGQGFPTAGHHQALAGEPLGPLVSG